MVDEYRHLALADKHIAAAEARIVDQKLLLIRIGETNRSVAEARRLLVNFEAALVQYRIHRRLILQEIERQTH